MLKENKSELLPTKGSDPKHHAAPINKDEDFVPSNIDLLFVPINFGIKTSTLLHVNLRYSCVENVEIDVLHLITIS